jgi:epoxyqueuosine reductase
MNTNEEKIRAFAQHLGFDACGFARADVPLEEEHERYRAFLEQGKHGTMQYLATNVEVRKRLDAATMLEGAKTVICLARRYDRPSEEQDPVLAKRIARYARGRDYHSVVRRKLRQLSAFVRRLGTPDAPVTARPLCDDAPILERVWAARAGLGFVGKNGLLIVPGQGSMVLLGEVLTTLTVAVDAPMAEKCGACIRCLEACPTQAFEQPFVLDPRKCISYWTIEHRGQIDAAYREAIGERLFGCDDCQTVCPWNAGQHRRPAATAPFEPHARWSTLGLPDLLEPARFGAITEASPVRRAAASGLARNAALVMGNALRSGTLSAQDRTSYQVALQQAAISHPESDTRELARWGLFTEGEE